MRDLLLQLFPPFCTIVVSLISSIVVIRSAQKARKEDTAKELNDSLVQFYYPFILLSKKTTQLYIALKAVCDLDEEGCISYLLKGNTFSGNEMVLFNEILQNDIKLNELILCKSNVVSNSDLIDDLSKLSSHYTILELASKGELKGDEEILTCYSFPSDVIRKMENAVLQIQKEILSYRK